MPELLIEEWLSPKTNQKLLSVFKPLPLRYNIVPKSSVHPAINAVIKHKRDENWCVTKTKINVFSNHKRIHYFSVRTSAEKKIEKKSNKRHNGWWLTAWPPSKEFPCERNENEWKDGCTLLTDVIPNELFRLLK